MKSIQNALTRGGTECPNSRVRCVCHDINDERQHSLLVGSGTLAHTPIRYPVYLPVKPAFARAVKIIIHATSYIMSTDPHHSLAQITLQHPAAFIAPAKQPVRTTATYHTHECSRSSCNSISISRSFITVSQSAIDISLVISI